MRAERWSLDQAVAEVRSPDLRHRLGPAAGVPVVVIAGDAGTEDPDVRLAAARLRALPIVTIGVDGPAIWDTQATDPAPLVAGALATPGAAIVATQILRSIPKLDTESARTIESFAYATLQTGAEYQAWLKQRGHRVRSDTAARVRLVDHGDRIDLVLTRSPLHNLLDAQMRNELADALTTLRAANSVPVYWRAEGSTFCGGGDPAEFGSVPTPLDGHLIRSVADLAPLLDPLADRITAVITGACVGAGVELVARCGTVVAGTDARFRLPELSMGLIPGAGGMWSISRRIGPARLLGWLLTNNELNRETALEWGLVDSTIDDETA